MTITIKFNNDIKHTYNSFEQILQDKDRYHTITYIYCCDNKLFSLPELPNSLKYLSCFNNKISKLPELPNSIVHINYYSNPIYRYIEKYFDGNEKKYIEYQNKIKKIFSNKIGDWYLDCKYNPKYLYCRKRLMKEYEELYN